VGWRSAALALNRHGRRQAVGVMAHDASIPSEFFGPASGQHNWPAASTALYGRAWRGEVRLLARQLRQYEWIQCRYQSVSPARAAAFCQKSPTAGPFAKANCRMTGAPRD